MSGNKSTLYPGVNFRPFVGLKYYFQIMKLHLCLYIGLSAILGHVMASDHFSFSSLFTGGIVLILAIGSAVLNNIQDREYDLAFFRTINRSLPQQKVPLFQAAVMSFAMIVTGFLGLFYMASWPCFFGGLLAVVAYNGLYTPLKKISLLAIIPGTISGMLPILIGWSATGRPIFDPSMMMTMAILGLWQIPHFFIIELRTQGRQLVRKGAKRFPCFTHVLSQQEIKIQILIWTSLYSLAIFFFLINGLINHPWLAGLLGLNAIGIIFFVSTLLLKQDRLNFSFAFVAINLSMLFFMGIGICDKVFV
ncbi:MAG: UbiA family prenyltransferase [Pseudomonadota bacterium]